MANVQTVLGDRSTDDLGFTLIHEHLTVGFPGYEWDNTSFDRKKEIAGAVEKLKEIKELVSPRLLIPVRWNWGATRNLPRNARTNPA